MHLTAFEMSVSGEGEAFPKAAVQSFHEKPMPTHEKNQVQRPTIIQQPRKQNGYVVKMHFVDRATCVMIITVLIEFTNDKN